MRKQWYRFSDWLHAYFARPARRSLRETLDDPPLDVLAAGVFGSLIGREVVYLSWLITAFTLGLFWVVGVAATAMVFDGVLHSLTVRSLFRLIRYELMNTADAADGNGSIAYTVAS